jgi:hypothetical protein
VNVDTPVTILADNAVRVLFGLHGRVRVAQHGREQASTTPQDMAEAEGDLISGCRVSYWNGK